MGPELDWSSGAPRATAFDDVYFSAQDGLAESRAVFLAGCGLPHAWAGRRRFTVGELGFGTGLNLLALLHLWRAARPGPDARLHMVSVEAHPLPAADAARALALWPELADLATPLLAAWPNGGRGARRGGLRIDWPDLGARLDLRVDDALAAVEGWDGRADAWFLDGVTPARNPDMWSPALLSAVAARTAPGGRLASFTVAGAVRRALADAGLRVDKRPGHGRKKERLEALAPGVAPPDPPPRRVAVVGGGVAAAALLRALAAEGLAAVQVASDAAGPAASGNAAALVTPRLDAGLGVAARLHAEAFARAVALYAGEVPGAVLARGALQLQRAPKDADRFARLAAWDGFAPDTAGLLDPEDTATALGEAHAPAALRLADALVVEPAPVLEAWTRGAGRVDGAVARLEPRPGGGWRLLDAAGATLAEADAVALAPGAGLGALLPAAPLRPVRGQATVADLAPETRPAAAAWGGYVVPTRTGVLFGATHGRGDADTAHRPADDAANLRALAQARPTLAARLEGAPLRGRAAVRLAVPDHLPLAGGVAGLPGLHVLGALGGRGFTLAPLLAEHVAARIAGAASPLPRDLAAAVDPARYATTGADQTEG